MAIESTQGYSPHTIQASVTPHIERTVAVPRNQQTSASDIDTNEESDRTGQHAFQVDITQQARDRLAAAASGNTQERDEPNAVFSDTLPSGQPQGPGAGQIINIVA